MHPATFGNEEETGLNLDDDDDLVNEKTAIIFLSFCV